MTAPTLEPLVVIDTRNQTWNPYTSQDTYDRLMEWARSNGINPDQTYRVEVYLLDCPFARVYEYEQAENGERIIVGDSYARREPYDVILASLPPAPAVPGEESR